MALIGLRVLATDGSAISQRQSFFRVLTLPLSVILLGIGLLMAVFGAERKALHDHIGGTCVVYDWGDRPAEMPAPLTSWLAGHGAIEFSAPPKSEARSCRAALCSLAQAFYSVSNDVCASKGRGFRAAWMT